MKSRGLLTVAALVVLLGIWSQNARGTQPKSEQINVLIVTGHDVKVHDWRATTACERATLEETGKFNVKVSEDTSILESSTLDRYDVIVLNYGFWDVPDLSEEGRAGLLKFVESGKGMVGLHFSSSSFQDWEARKELFGRVWVTGASGHGPRHEFTVQITKPEHPIMKGLGRSFQVDDELYAKLQGDAEIEVLATADSPWSGNTEPMIFVKPHGKGRVVRNVLGHDVKVRSNTHYKKILVRSVEWAATGQVTE